MRRATAVVVALALAACTESALIGPPTEAICPPGSTLTWDSFGQAFMARYCTRCHAAALRGDDRHGAPSFHDFDTAYGVRAVRVHIDETTAAGPAAVNTAMPPDGERPSLAERQQLGEWLACRAP